jgi:hypothetical protein
MQLRCSVCWSELNLEKCSKDDCSSLLCSVHINRYGGCCLECWDSDYILSPPSWARRNESCPVSSGLCVPSRPQCADARLRRSTPLKAAEKNR